jgi:hypothetical protein
MAPWQRRFSKAFLTRRRIITFGVGCVFGLVLSDLVRSLPKGTTGFDLFLRTIAEALVRVF